MRYTTMPSPLGEVLLGFDDAALLGLWFRGQTYEPAVGEGWVRHDAHPESAEFRGIQRTQHLVGRDPKLGGIRCNAVQISRRPQPAVAVVGALGEFPRNSVPHGGGTKALHGHESESAPKTPTAQLNHGHAKQRARREVGGKKSD